MTRLAMSIAILTTRYSEVVNKKQAQGHHLDVRFHEEMPWKIQNYAPFERLELKPLCDTAENAAGKCMYVNTFAREVTGFLGMVRQNHACHTSLQ